MRPETLAVYIHVDDGILASSRRPGQQLCDRWAGRLAGALEQTGFVIKEVLDDLVVDRVVGYHPERSPPALGLPPEKAARLEAGVRYLAGRSRVDVEQLRSLVGVWLWEPSQARCTVFSLKRYPAYGSSNLCFRSRFVKAPALTYLNG